MKFKFYVLNYNINENRIELFNIFDNRLVQQEVEKSVKKYLRAPKKFKFSDPYGIVEEVGFEGLCQDVRRTIMWQELGRCEYEIIVGNQFTDSLEKWSCYDQVATNIPAIVREVIYQYKQQAKTAKQK